MSTNSTVFICASVFKSVCVVGGGGVHAHACTYKDFVSTEICNRVLTKNVYKMSRLNAWCKIKLFILNLIDCNKSNTEIKINQGHQVNVEHQHHLSLRNKPIISSLWSLFFASFTKCRDTEFLCYFHISKCEYNIGSYHIDTSSNNATHTTSCPVSQMF